MTMPLMLNEIEGMTMPFMKNEIEGMPMPLMINEIEGIKSCFHHKYCIFVV